MLHDFLENILHLQYSGSLFAAIEALTAVFAVVNELLINIAQGGVVVETVVVLTFDVVVTRAVVLVFKNACSSAK